MRAVVVPVILLLSVHGSPAPGELLTANERRDTNFYHLTFGDQGQGTDGLSGTGLENHDAFGTGVNLRLYDGGTGGSQANGIVQIHFKNRRRSQEEDEIVSDLLPNRVPALGSNLAGEGRFDGTALWLGHSRFKPGTTTSWDGTREAKADAGSAVRPDPSHFIPVELPGRGRTNVSILLSQQVYVPGHARDSAGATPIPTGVCVQPYLDREGFGLTVPGGHGNRVLNFSPDTWHLLEIRADFELDGGPTYSSSDDRGTVTYAYSIDGGSIGPADTITLNGLTNRAGPIRFGPGYGLQRGWQGSAPEAFIDDIAAWQIRGIQ